MDDGSETFDEQLTYKVHADCKNDLSIFDVYKKLKITKNTGDIRDLMRYNQDKFKTNSTRVYKSGNYFYKLYFIEIWLPLMILNRIVTVA